MHQGPNGWDIYDLNWKCYAMGISHNLENVKSQTPSPLTMGIIGKFGMSPKLLSTANVIKSSQQGGRSCATARPPVSASAGAPALAGSPSIRAFVAKSVLSRFTRFWMYRFQPFMVMNGYFMIMMLVQGCQC